jgi:cytochrome b
VEHQESETIHTSTVMKNILVWDLPIRLFHWTFAASLTAALAIGFLVDDDSPVFQLHMLFGLVAAFLLVVRLVLGLVGSRYNRFTAMPLHPAEVMHYMVGAFTGKARRYIGHNPGCALAAILMFALVPLLVASGAGWLGETGEDLHEGLAIALGVTIIAHILGIIWHSIRHKEALAVSMLTGRKEGPEADGLPSSHPGWAVAIFAGCAAWIGALFANHDPQAASVRIPVLGTVIQLGESEGAENGGEHEKEDADDDD